MTLVSGAARIQASAVVALRLLLTLALWVAFTGLAQASEGSPELHGGRVGPLAWASSLSEVALGTHDVLDRRLPTDPGEKAKGELPSLGKIVMALAVGDAWPAGAEDVPRLDPSRDGLGPNRWCVVPNARAPPVGR